MNLKRKNDDLEPLLPTEYTETTILEEENICECGKEFPKESRLLQHKKTCSRILNDNENEQKNKRNQEKKEINSFNTEQNFYFSNTTDDPYLYLPNGTILGNKKYHIYFLQKYSEEKKKETRIVHKKIKIPERKEYIKNNLKISLQKNTCIRARDQWMQ